MNVIDADLSGHSTVANPTVEVETNSGRIIYPKTGLIPWLRYLYIEFKNSQGETMSIGGYDDSLAIEVKGTKTLASAGDSATIEIYNLPLLETIKLLNGGYTKEVRIWCGYYNTDKIKIFDGGVVYLEEGKDDMNTSKVKIQCACRLVSDKLQSRMPLSLNAGINLYRAIEEVEAAYGIQGQLKIDESLKYDTLKGSLSRFDTLQQWLEAIISSSSANKNYATSTSETDAIVSVIGARQMGSGNTFVIDTRDINLQAFPTVSSDGLTVILAPIYNMTPGDIISIDNTASALINALDGDSENTYLGNQIYVDKDGLYNIREMTYTLTNRSSAFNVKVLAISKHILATMMNNEEQEETTKQEIIKTVTNNGGGHYTQ